MPPASSLVLVRPLVARRVSLARTAIAAVLFITAARTTGAQTAPDQKSRFEFLVSSGTLVPTGAPRNAIKRADQTTAQLSYLVRPNVAITTSFGWARSRDLATVDDPKLDVFTYDVGAEVRANRRQASRTVTFTPFVGVGAGARSYNYRSLDVGATHNLAAYGSVGGELGYRRVRLRLEARDYVSGFKPLAVAGTAGRRNDVAVMVGFRFVRR